MREWLPSISNRKKWECDQVDIEVGDVVLAVMKDAERGKWPLGKIVKITEAKDGHVRRAKVLIAGKIFERGINSLIKILKND